MSGQNGSGIGRRILKPAAPFLIEQKYEDYTFDKHQLWGELVRRRRAQLETLACLEYWEGFETLPGNKSSRIPAKRNVTG